MRRKTTAAAVAGVAVAGKEGIGKPCTQVSQVLHNGNNQLPCLVRCHLRVSIRGNELYCTHATTPRDKTWSTCYATNVQSLFGTHEAQSTCTSHAVVMAQNSTCFSLLNAQIQSALNNSSVCKLCLRCEAQAVHAQLTGLMWRLC